LPRITRAGAYSALLALLALFAGAAAAEVASPYLAARHGAKCDLEPSGALTCRYVVGKNLEFFLHRVTEKDVRLRIVRNSPQGEHTVEPAMRDGCAVVKHGRAGLAAGGGELSFGFVSGRNGMVYRSLRECRLSR
jgi:hypothetical protein